MREVWSLPTRGSLERLLLVALDEHADKDGYVSVSMEQMREMTQMSIARLRTAKKNCIADGLLTEVIPPRASVPAKYQISRQDGYTHTTGIPLSLFEEPVDPAVALAKRWFGQAPRKPMCGFKTVKQIVDRALEAGWDDDAIIDAMNAAPTMSVRAVEFQLNRAQELAAPPAKNQFTGMIHVSHNCSDPLCSNGWVGVGDDGAAIRCSVCSNPTAEMM